MSLSTTFPLAPATSRGAGIWLAPLLLFLAAVALYCVNLDRLPDPDELYHILAAHGLVATGEPRIAEGHYDRVLLQTRLVAWSFELFGESLWAARLPSVLFTGLADVLLFLWLRRRAGSAAAWLGAGLFAASPFAIGVAQFCRFYALQTLSFTAACVLTDEALGGAASRRQQLACLALAAAAALLALYLQPTTLLGLAGLGAWAVGALAWPYARDPALPSRRKLLVVAAVLVLAIVVVAAAAASGALGALWERYRWTPLFNRGTENQFWWYHAWLNLFYPSLWPLVGIVGMAGLAARPRPVSLALVVFAVGFLLNSFAAAKALRYLAYAQPFLFAVWGIGLVALWPRLRDLGRDLVAGVRRQTGAGWAARLLFAGALAFTLLANPFWLRSATMLADVTVPPEVPAGDWRRARPVLAPLVQKAGVVVSTEELGTLYFLGRFDARYSPSKLEELPPEQQHDFGIDPRTGRAVIASEAALQQVMACFQNGLILGLASDWGKPYKIGPALGAFIQAHTTPVELPKGSHLFAYRWQQPLISGPPADCGPIMAIARHPPLP